MKPNFIYIGTGKAGSSWLSDALSRHPDVFLTPVKETNFFDLNFQRGLPWYERFFEGATQPAVGEIAHRYIRHPEVAQRIRATLGPVRLLAVYRRPEEYVESLYLFAVRNGRFAGSLEDWMAQRFEPSLVRYGEMLSPFLAEFGCARIHVACFDDLREDPAAFLDGICKFLGIAKAPLTPSREKVNGAAQPRSRALALAVNRTSKFIKRRGGQRTVAWVKNLALVQRALYQPLAGPRPMLSSSSRAAIRSIAEPEVQRVDAQFGTALWQRWYAESAPCA